jgi:hypothetical protein
LYFNDFPGCHIDLCQFYGGRRHHPITINFTIARDAAAREQTWWRSGCGFVWA